MSADLPDFSFRRMTVQEVFGRFDGLRNTEGKQRPVEWNGFMRFNGIYEYPTVEYIGALSTYLARRAEEIAAVRQEPARIVEVAAGIGLLSHLLNEKFKEQKSDIVITASDNGSWRSPVAPLPHVINEDYRATLQREQPHIILAAWLPEDFTPDFRSVNPEEYVLIGITKDYSIHGSQATWGRDEHGNPVETPEYAQDGYDMIPLTDLQQYQFCYRSYDRNSHLSETVVFRKSEQTEQ